MLNVYKLNYTYTGTYIFFPVILVSFCMIFFWFQIDEIVKEYIHADDVYEKVQDVLEQELLKGLGKSSNKDANIKMFPTYVRALPDGSGKWLFLCFCVRKKQVLSTFLHHSMVLIHEANQQYT